MKNTTHNWYDLPTYYDVSFSYDMKDELSFISNVFRKYLILNSPKLLEPACGTGRLIVPLVKKGFNCSGFDLNENALLYLKEKRLLQIMGMRGLQIEKDFAEAFEVIRKIER